MRPTAISNCSKLRRNTTAKSGESNTAIPRRTNFHYDRRTRLTAALLALHDGT
jgi:hypothetical protein